MQSDFGLATVSQTEPPIRLFVGCSPNGEDAESMMVLEYSIRKNTKRPVQITWMKMSHDPASPFYVGEGGWNTQTWATPFSGFRWSIPEICGFKGKAIYCDSDFIFLSDLEGYWNQEFEPGKVVMAKGQGAGWRYCTCLWNNEAARGVVLPLSRLRSIPEAHQRMMGFFANNQEIVQPFAGTWNTIDGEELRMEEIDGLHYSDMGTQFHLKYAIPRLAASGKKHWFDGQILSHWRNDLQTLFDVYYAEALASGMKVEDYVPQTEFGPIVKESQIGYTTTQRKNA